MLWTKLLAVAPRLLVRLLPYLLAGAIAIILYQLGYAKRDAEAVAEAAAVAAKHEQARLEAELVYQGRLAAAQAEKARWHAFAQHQSERLAETTRRLDRQTQQITREIEDAVRNDQTTNACAGGIGTDSLRLYKRAFGYDAD